MTTAEAIAATGGLSSPSKMPGFSYGLPVHSCLTGSRMRGVEGSVCHHCYACKGRYTFPVVVKAAERRLAKLNRDDWIDGMVTLIERDACPDFRFHDTGDIQSVSHLERIAEVARRLPHRRFRLPTLEFKMVHTWLAGYPAPDNLFIRLSAPMIDQPVPPHYWTMRRVLAGFSRVTTDPAKIIARDELLCPATTTRNACEDCRACWERAYDTIVYLKH